MDQNDQLRREIAAGLERIGMDAASLSKRIGRSKDYVREFLSGRKRSMAQDSADKIRSILKVGIMVPSNTNDKIVVDRIILETGLEVLLKALTVPDRDIAEAIEFFVGVLTAPPFEELDNDPVKSSAIRWKIGLERLQIGRQE